MTIIATADVHLGMKFSGYEAMQPELAEERFRALERVVEAGNAREADLLVIAGDLFHRVGAAAGTVERAAAILDRFAGAAIAVLPGNHDYRVPAGDRLWARFLLAAGDRTIVLDRAGPFDLSHYDLDVTLLAGPCDAHHGSSHRLEWVSGFAPAHGHLVIGVAHGSIEGLTLDAEGHYFPMDRRLLASLPADLWLVGHTHRSHDERGARLVVPGTPEPDGFDCPEGGAAALVTFTSPAGEADSYASYEVETVPTGRFRFIDTPVELHDARGEDTEEELRDAILAAVPGGEVLVRISVGGTLASEAFERWNTVYAGLSEDPRIVRITDENLVRVLTQDDVDRRFAARSFAHRLLSRLLERNDRDALAEALSVIDEVGA